MASSSSSSSCCSSCLRGLAAVVAEAARSAIRSVTCLSACHYLAALAIIPYFLSAAYGDNYFQFVVMGPRCGFRAKPAGGLGLHGDHVMALFGSAVQAVAAFAGPALVGPRKFQFREHVALMAMGNLFGAVGGVLVAALGGLSPDLCGSLPLMLLTKLFSAVALGINSSVGVAAVLCWYSGRYQALVVSALASRSVWAQLGGILGPETFTDSFTKLKGGKPAALFAAAVYAMGSMCVVAAHVISEAMQRRCMARKMQLLAVEEEEGRREGREGTVLLSDAERRLAGQAGRMTAGFSDCSPSEAAMWRRKESSSILLPASSSLRRRTGRSSQMQQEGQQPRKI